MIYTDTKYIKVDWPDYQQFMEDPRFKEECFFCAETFSGSYFIPEYCFIENTPTVTKKIEPAHYDIVTDIGDMPIDVEKRDAFLIQHSKCSKECIEYHLDHFKRNRSWSRYSVYKM